jgi:hypothetical protein
MNPMAKISMMRRHGCGRRGEQGVAAVELALVFPILLVLLLGGLDITRYMLYHQKVDRITFSVADMVAQSQSVTKLQMDDIVLAAGQIMQPFAFGSNGVVIVSSVYKDPAQTYPTIRWQYVGGGSLARVSKVGIVNGTPALPAGLTLNDKDNVIIAETYYLFDPTFNSGVVTKSDIYKEAVYKPRLGSLLTLPNS